MRSFLMHYAENEFSRNLQNGNSLIVLVPKRFEWIVNLVIEAVSLMQWFAFKILIIYLLAKII